MMLLLIIVLMSGSVFKLNQWRAAFKRVVVCNREADQNQEHRNLLQSLDLSKHFI